MRYRAFYGANENIIIRQYLPGVELEFSKYSFIRQYLSDIEQLFSKYTIIKLYQQVESIVTDFIIQFILIDTNLEKHF